MRESSSNTAKPKVKILSEAHELPKDKKILVKLLKEPVRRVLS